MPTKEKSDKKKSFIRQAVELLVVMVFAGFISVYIAPGVKHWLFPDQMARIEKLLEHSACRQCQLYVYRRDERLIWLVIEKDSKPPVKTEIYKGVVREIDKTSDSITLFAHSISDDINGVTYLTRTLIETDADLKQLRRLEVSFCGRIKDQSGNVRYKDHEPIYECDVPELRAVCLCADDQ
jgi:hypothetical protein